MTRYQLSALSEKRISMSTAYRLVKLEGRLKNFDADMLEALCDIFDVEPGELFERTPQKRGKR